MSPPVRSEPVKTTIIATARPFLFVETADHANRVERTVAEIPQRRMVLRPVLHEHRLPHRQSAQPIEELAGRKLLARPVLVTTIANIVPALCASSAAAAHGLHEQV